MQAQSVEVLLNTLEDYADAVNEAYTAAVPARAARAVAQVLIA
jgi:hypothetical protein